MHTCAITIKKPLVLNKPKIKCPYFKKTILPQTHKKSALSEALNTKIEYQ